MTGAPDLLLGRVAAWPGAPSGWSILELVGALALLTVVGGAATSACRSAVLTGRAHQRLARADASTRGPIGHGGGRTSPIAGACRASSVATRRLVARFGWVRARADVEHALLLEAVARSRRSGASLPQALSDAVGPPAHGTAIDDLRAALWSARAGLPLADALRSWSRADDDPARVLSGSALCFGAAYGGASARSLDAAAAGLRDRAALAREVRALTAQAKASAAVMVLAPVVFSVVGAVIDRRLASVLLTTPTGLGCLGAGAVLDAAGALWMAQLARSVT